MSKLDKLRTMLQEMPDDVFLNYSYAMELAKGEDTTAISTAFERIRQLDPHYVPAYFQQAQALARLGQLQTARDVLQAGIEVARSTGDSHALGEMTEFLESL